MAIYIQWTEPSAEFDHWDYVGGGITSARFRPTTITKKCRWSTEETPEQVRAAEQYIKDEFQDRPGAIVVRIPD